MNFGTLKIFAYTGAGGSVFGAITHDQLLTWTGAAIAAGSAVFSGVLAAWHRYKEAKRVEFQADVKAGLARADERSDRQDAAASARSAAVNERLDGVMKQRDKLITQNEELLRHLLQLTERQSEIALRVDKARCPYLRPDGSARCTDSPHTMPASDLTQPHSEGS